MTADGFICKRCGRCCSGKGDFDFHGSVSTEEYKEIAETAPKHVLRWFSKLPYIDAYDYFISPRAGNEPTRCPWLKKKDGLYVCVIHHCKPPVCNNFPIDVDQVLTASCKCRGLEHLGQVMK